MSLFINVTLNGVSTGMIFAALALALVFIYRATGIVNFAQGAMGMLTTFIAFSLLNRGLGYWEAFPLRWRSGSPSEPGRRESPHPPASRKARAQPGDRDDRAARRARRHRRQHLGQHLAWVPPGLLTEAASRSATCVSPSPISTSSFLCAVLSLMIATLFPVQGDEPRACACAGLGVRPRGWRGCSEFGWVES